MAMCEDQSPEDAKVRHDYSWSQDTRRQVGNGFLQHEPIKANIQSHSRQHLSLSRSPTVLYCILLDSKFGD